MCAASRPGRVARMAGRKSGLGGGTGGRFDESYAVDLRRHEVHSTVYSVYAVGGLVVWWGGVFLALRLDPISS